MNRICIILLLLSLPLLAGCEKIEQVFSGLDGRVALGPVEGAVVEVYDASEFVSFESKQGFIAATTTDASGNFRLAIPDQQIGRPLLCAATFPNDDPLTPLDERAKMVRSDDSIQLLDARDGRWVAMIDFFEGLTVTVAISPLSTLAFEALQYGPSQVVGAGNNRFIDQHIRLTNYSVANTFGLESDPSRTLPAHVVSGPNAAPGDPSRLDDGLPSLALRHVLDQLDQSSRAFAAATATPLDGPSDFFKALFRDARDGRMDGASFGDVDAVLSAAGAPAVSGSDAAGVPKLINYLLAQSSSDQSANIDALRARQTKSRGSYFQPIVESVSRTRLSHRSVDTIEITGSGFQSDMELVFGSDETAKFNAGGVVFSVVGDEGDRGAILDVSGQSVSVRMPNFATVAPGFLPSAAYPLSSFNLFLRHRYAGESGESRATLERFVGTFEIVFVDGLQIIQTRLLREGITATARASMLSGAINAAPASLDPANDDVYALEIAIANGSEDTINDVGLELANLLLTSSQGAYTAGELGANADLVFDDQTVQDANAITLAAGETRILRARLGKNSASAIPAGALLKLRPAIKGINSQTLLPLAIVAESAAALECSIGTSDFTPTPVSQSVPAPASIAPTQSADLAWLIDLTGRAGGASRALTFRNIRLEVVVGGETRLIEQIAHNPQAWSADLDGLRLESLSLSNTTSAQSLLGVRNSVGPLALKLRARNLSAAPASVQINLRLDWIEEASGAAGSISAAFQLTLN